MIKRKYDSEILVEEYDNPPMMPNVEYRTTERVHDKVVYKKATSDGDILYRLEGETEWRPYRTAMGDINATLLWENASPASTFAAQTVTLDLSGCNAVMVEYRINTTVIFTVSFFVKIGKSVFASAASATSGTIFQRVTEATANGIAFEGAYTAVNAAPNNAAMIPQAIYGIKGVITE